MKRKLCPKKVFQSLFGSGMVGSLRIGFVNLKISILSSLLFEIHCGVETCCVHFKAVHLLLRDRSLTMGGGGVILRIFQNFQTPPRRGFAPTQNFRTPHYFWPLKTVILAKFSQIFRPHLHHSTPSRR